MRRYVPLPIFPKLFRLTGVKAEKRLVQVASKNLPTLLIVTEGKPRPALF